MDRDCRPRHPDFGSHRLKTLAAFLVCIDRLNRASQAGALLTEGPEVVCVSP
jgi:hypothetical protein